MKTMKQKTIKALAAIILAGGIGMASTGTAVAQTATQTEAQAAVAQTESPVASHRHLRPGLRANLLTWALGSPGLGLTLDVGPRWQFGIDGSYGNWDISHRTHAVRISTAGVEARRYFKSEWTRREVDKLTRGGVDRGTRARGAYLGINVRYTHFNQLLTDVGREGDLLTAGILVGYTFTLGHPRWSLDASLGCGYIHRSYDRYSWYPPAGEFRLLGSRTRNGLGLTNLAVGLGYQF